MFWNHKLKVRWNQFIAIHCHLNNNKTQHVQKVKRFSLSLNLVRKMELVKDTGRESCIVMWYPVFFRQPLLKVTGETSVVYHLPQIPGNFGSEFSFGKNGACRLPFAPIRNTSGVPTRKTGLPFQNFRLSRGTNRRNVYHLHPNRNFREFVVNGKQPS